MVNANGIKGKSLCCSNNQERDELHRKVQTEIKETMYERPRKRRKLRQRMNINLLEVIVLFYI